ncbi:hypothetical protein GCM10010532_093750 [Dactylosporangium siamense]|uniref:Uncharacterized protein n=1 Tax=Dactylosporangium siamense TaxID=685454 RepID=A0A919PU76_9ACTN|nr:hypothetical protein Dsi01nite_083200 [Dactylosporangium siamense]
MSLPSTGSDLKGGVRPAVTASRSAVYSEPELVELPACVADSTEGSWVEHRASTAPCAACGAAEDETTAGPGDGVGRCRNIGYRWYFSHHVNATR